MKKRMLTANHHQVTCWNENPFFPHYCVDDRHLLCNISAGRGREEWVAGERGRGSLYRKEHSALYVVNNYHCSRNEKEPPKVSLGEDMRTCCLLGLVPPFSSLARLHSRFPASRPTVNQSQTNWRHGDVLLCMKTQGVLLVRIPKWTSDFLGSSFRANDRKLKSTDN